ncbi:MAG TPA: hypothetical protein VEP90_08960, partial [Methylomirabilota bacterium]|nr:hypothetical protein [Methylomirabilota bacterium]
MILLFQFLFNRRRLYTVFQFELATLLIYFFIRFAIGGVYFSKVVLVAPIPLANLPFIERLANIPAIVWYYLTTTFFPLRLAINQLWIVTELTGQDFYLPLLLDSLFFLALCMAGVYLYIHKKSYFKPYLFFLLWFLFGIGMLLQIFPLDMTVSDRWFYFPIVGLLGIIGVGIQMMLNKHGSYSFINHEKTKLVTALFGAVLILLLSVRTIGRNNDYHDDITLVTQASHIQDNFLIEDTLGVEYAKAGNTKEALPHLQHSVSLYPYATNLYHLGLFYETSGNMPKTIEYYNKAVTAAETSDPTAYAHSLVDYQLYERVARLLLLSHKYQAAEKISKNGLLSHSTSLLWLEFALSENKLHRWKEAFEAVMQTNPTSAS